MATSALRRAATAMLEGLGTRRWGYPPRLMAPVVEQLGPIRALGWFAWNMPRYERTLRSLGAVRTHLLCLAISLINNCEYCTYSYAYALELAFLDEHGRLFPLGERTIGTLRSLPPAAARHCLIDATQRAGLHVDARWLDRTFAMALTDDRRPTDADDVRIAHLVRMFGQLNTIAIASGIAPDEAPTPLNKDQALKRRYAELRGAAG
jgi:AhpD family alkylhydroperoxidase